MAEAAPVAPQATPATAANPATPAETSAPANGAPNGAPNTPAKTETPTVAELLDLEANGAKFVTVTVDGEEMRMSLKDALQSVSRTKASQKRFEEAAKGRKEVEEQKARLKTFLEAAKDPQGLAELAKRLGMSKRQILEAWAPELAAEEMMTPEERAHHEKLSKMTAKEREFAERERKIKEREDAIYAQQVEARSKIEAKRLSAEFDAALKAMKVPASPKWIARMADLMTEALNHGTDATPAYLAELVRDEFAEGTRALTADLTPEQLIELFGKDKMDAVRKAELERALGAKSAPAVSTQPKPEPGPQKSLDQIREEREAERDRRR